MAKGNIINHYAIKIAICEALGLDAKEVQKVVITLGGADEVRVDISTWTTADEIKAMTPVLKEYKLVPRDDGNGLDVVSDGADGTQPA